MKLKKQAVRYHTKYGWKILPANGKIPIVKWQEWQDKEITTDQIEKWWDRNPNSNIAVITGAKSGICVLDVDGADLTGLHLPTTVTATTNENHYHYYFKHPGFPVSNSAGQLDKGLDFRGDGGIVILPPSQHFDKNGKPDVLYTWLLKPSETDLADIPLWLIDKVKEKRWVNNSEKFDWNQAINITKGSRDQTIFRAADSLAAKGFNFEIALTILRGANSTYKPPLEDSIVVEKLKNAFNFIESGKTKENSIYNASFLSSVPKLITELTPDQAKVDWIWEGYLARGHLTFFSALWKVGKSTLIAYFLKALQEGKEFAGQPITPTKVLILSEESETIWARRREDLGLTGDIYVHCRPTKLKLDHKQWLTLLESEEKFCTEKGINLFIIDTISTFWPTRDEGNNPEIDAALIPLNVFYEKDICVMTVHHFRKSGGDQGTATRGGGGIGSRADILIECTRLDATNPDDSQRVLRTYSRFEESPPELVIELVGDEYLARGTRSEVSKEAKLQVVLGILQDQGDLTVSEILSNWDSENKKPVPRTIRNYMESLLQDGRVIQSGKKLVGKTEAPSYSLNNGGKESNTYIRDSSVIAPGESIQDSQEVKKPEKKKDGKYDWL